MFHRYEEVSYSQKAPKETSGSKTKPIAPLSTLKGDVEPKNICDGGHMPRPNAGYSAKRAGDPAQAPKQTRERGARQQARGRRSYAPTWHPSQRSRLRKLRDAAMPMYPSPASKQSGPMHSQPRDLFWTTYVCWRSGAKIPGNFIWMDSFTSLHHHHHGHGTTNEEFRDIRATKPRKN